MATGVKGRGLVPRDWSMHRRGCFAAAPPFPNNLILSWDEINKRLRDMKAAKTTLLDHRAANYDTLKSYNQNGYGLCWAFSSTKAATYLRVQKGLPPARLAPYWVAGKVMDWRDKGGWGGQSMTEIAQAGVPLESFCADYHRANDTPAATANASMHRVVLWYDGTEDRETNARISGSAFCYGWVPVKDYNHLSHSMCGACYDPDTDSWIDDNSWGDINDEGPQGTYVQKGKSGWPDNVVVAVEIQASVT